jgi:hypothetical protein
MKLVLIGGYPKGFKEPFHTKTKSGRVLHKITNELQIKPALFDLWESKEEEDSRKLSIKKILSLNKFIKNNYKLVALGRYIEETLVKNGFACEYLPHPASRDKKFLLQLKKGLNKFSR